MNEVNGYTEDHSPLNWRIFWSFLFNAVGGMALLYEYLHGFKNSRTVLAAASAFYLVCYNSYSFYQAYVAQPSFYRGTAKDGKQTLWLASKLLLPEAVYELQALHPTAGGTFKQGAQARTPIGSWITEDGFVDAAAVVADLQKFRLAAAKSD